MGFRVSMKRVIGTGQLRYVPMQLGGKTSYEVDELLKGIQIGACVFSLYRRSHLINIAAAMAACIMSHLYARPLVIVVPSRTHNVMAINK